MQHKIMPRLITTLKETQGFRKTLLSTQRGHEALRMNRNERLFYIGLYERETQKAGEIEYSPWLSSTHFHCCNRSFVKSLQGFILL